MSAGDSRLTLVFEDDFVFTDNAMAPVLSQLARIIEQRPNFNAIMLSYTNPRLLNEKIDGAQRLVKGQGRAGFLVNGDYALRLWKSFNESAEALVKRGGGYPYSTWGGDVHWGLLQRKDEWWAMVPRGGHQSAGYSDIQSKRMDYTASGQEA